MRALAHRFQEKMGGIDGHGGLEQRRAGGFLGWSALGKEEGTARLGIAEERMGGGEGAWAAAGLVAEAERREGQNNGRWVHVVREKCGSGRADLVANWSCDSECWKGGRITIECLEHGTLLLAGGGDRRSPRSMDRRFPLLSIYCSEFAPFVLLDFLHFPC